MLPKPNSNGKVAICQLGTLE